MLVNSYVVRIPILAHNRNSRERMYFPRSAEQFFINCSVVSY
ncbi:hypothetical protein [Bacillus phage vB_BceS-M2]